MQEKRHNQLDRFLYPNKNRVTASAAVVRATVATVEVTYTGAPGRVDRFKMPIVTDSGKK